MVGQPQSLSAVAIEREFRIVVTRSWIILIELNKTRGLFETVENGLPVISWPSGPAASLSSLIAANRNTQYDSTHDKVLLNSAYNADVRFPLRSGFLY